MKSPVSWLGGDFDRFRGAAGFKLAAPFVFGDEIWIIVSTSIFKVHKLTPVWIRRSTLTPNPSPKLGRGEPNPFSQREKVAPKGSDEGKTAGVSPISQYRRYLMNLEMLVLHTTAYGLIKSVRALCVAARLEPAGDSIIS